MPTEARALRNEKTHHRHHRRPAGSSQGGEHVGRGAWGVGREVRSKLRYRKRDSARDVTTVSVMVVAGGASLAYALPARAASRTPSPAGGHGPRDALSQRHRARPKTSEHPTRYYGR